MNSNNKKQQNPKKRPLSAEEISWCNKMLEIAEPYTKEETDALEFDGPYDFDRMNAFFAKQMLEDDDRLKELGVEIKSN